jgi:hypothetical protein
MDQAPGSRLQAPGGGKRERHGRGKRGFRLQSEERRERRGFRLQASVRGEKREG